MFVAAGWQLVLGHDRKGTSREVLLCIALQASKRGCEGLVTGADTFSGRVHVPRIEQKDPRQVCVAGFSAARAWERYHAGQNQAKQQKASEVPHSNFSFTSIAVTGGTFRVGSGKLPTWSSLRQVPFHS